MILAVLLISLSLPGAGDCEVSCFSIDLFSESVRASLVPILAFFNAPGLLNSLRGFAEASHPEEMGAMNSDFW